MNNKRANLLLFQKKAIEYIQEIAINKRPGSWKNFGTYNEILTKFRRLWHVLVLHGKPKNDL